MTDSHQRLLAPKISVITVVMNDPNGFSKTLESVHRQDGSIFEWVVIDSSTDKSVIPQLLLKSGQVVTYQWTEPHGIYSAMNQGARQARGKYLYFLNAGDTFTDAGTLSVLCMALEAEEPEWVYAGVNFFDKNGNPLVEPQWSYSQEFRHRFSRGRFPPHQGVLVRHDVFADLGGFSPRFTIASDYHFILRLSLRGDPLILGQKIANFVQGGASSLSWQRAQREFHQIRGELFPANHLQRLEESWYRLKARIEHLVADRRNRPPQ